jgi:predicted nucleic acid-binding protein
VRFFDASALVKRYVRESATTRVRRLLARGDVVVSRLSEVEVVSAFARLSRVGMWEADERDRASAAFTRDLSQWHVVEIAGEVTARARILLSKHPIRAGDAIQLASAQYFQQMLARPLELFVAFDDRLIDAARAEGLDVA